MATSKAVAALLDILQHLYPSREVDAGTATAWHWALQDVSDDRLEWAAKRLVREPGRTFFPTPNELRAFLPPVAAPLTLANPDDAIVQYYDGHSSACRKCGGRKGIHDEGCDNAEVRSAD